MFLKKKQKIFDLNEKLPPSNFIEKTTPKNSNSNSKKIFEKQLAHLATSMKNIMIKEVESINMFPPKKSLSVNVNDEEDHLKFSNANHSETKKIDQIPIYNSCENDNNFNDFDIPEEENLTELPTTKINQKPFHQENLQDLDIISFLKKKHIQIIDLSEISFNKKDFIGKGGIGHVYKGFFNKKTIVAIKEYVQYNLHDKEDKIGTFILIKEIINTLAINIPKSNKCYGVAINQETGVIYSIHELAECSLKDLLKKGSLDLNSKLSLISEIAEILFHLKMRRIVHRDLKPANFLVLKSGELQVCDFGSIKKIEKNELNYTKNLLYTVKYAPPEFINNLQIADFYSDIWSFGIILYEIFYEEDLWEGKTNYEVEKMINNSIIPEIKENSRVPSKITDIIRKCLIFEGSKRITIEEINDQFEEIKACY